MGLASQDICIDQKLVVGIRGKRVLAKGSIQKMQMRAGVTKRKSDRRLPSRSRDGYAR